MLSERSKDPGQKSPVTRIIHLVVMPIVAGFFLIWTEMLFLGHIDQMTS